MKKRRLEIQRNFIIIEILFFPLVFQTSITLIPWDIDWNIPNYHWSLFQTNFNFRYFYVIFNNISDKKKLFACFLSLYQKWMSHITPNNMLDINLIQVLILILKTSTRFYQKLIFYIFWNIDRNSLEFYKLIVKFIYYFKKNYIVYF